MTDRELILLYFGLLERLALLLEQALKTDAAEMPPRDDAQRRLWEKKRRLRMLAALGQIGGDS